MSLEKFRSPSLADKFLERDRLAEDARLEEEVKKQEALVKQDIKDGTAEKAAGKKATKPKGRRIKSKK